MNTTSNNSQVVSGKNLFARFWFNISLANKLTAAFSLLFIFGLAIAGVNYWGLNQVQSGYEEVVEEGGKIASLSQQLALEISGAQSAEKDFLLRWKFEGYDTAYQNYVIPHQQHISNAQALIEELSAFIPALKNTDPLVAQKLEFELNYLNYYVEEYETNFQNALLFINQRGVQDTGLEGEFRIAIQTLESKLYNQEGLEPLIITMLQIRRREKDYLLRGDIEYVNNVDSLMTQLNGQVADSDLLDSTQKAELKTLTDNYLLKFHTLVDTEKKINANINRVKFSAQNIVPIINNILILGNDLATTDTASARADSSQTQLIIAITLIATLLITFLLATGISRQITNPVKSLTRAVKELESGNYSSQVQATTGDEIGTLASSFNGMANQLQTTISSLSRKTQILSTSNEVSRRISTILEPNRLAFEVVEQIKNAFNYYHAHIYLKNEATDELIMAGGTGDVGKTLLSRGHKISKGKGLVGRAAENNTLILVSDTTKDPNWLPNELLPDTKSEIAVPISLGSEVLGVLDVQQNNINGLTQEDAELLQTISFQVAVALRNAQTYSQTQQVAERESLINEINRKIQNTATIEQALQVTVRELGSALGAKDSRIVLSLPEKN